MTHHYNTEECTFRFSFYIFLESLICSWFKISIALRALSWKYFVLIETKSCGKEILRDIYEFRVYIFLLKVLLHMLVIFWKIRIDTLYEDQQEKFPPIKLPQGKLPLPGKLPTRKLSPRVFSPISLIALLHLTLCFDKFLQM